MDRNDLDALGLVPIEGSEDRFRVRRVFCVGRNYAEHAREMGHDDREPPFFFGKAPEALVTGESVGYPPATEDLHHEVELVVAIGEIARDVAPERVADIIAGYAVGIDLTRRDMQSIAKKQARPWYLSKSFVGSAPIGSLVSPAKVGHPRAGRIWLEVNDKPRQDGDLAAMIWSVEEIIGHLSALDVLLPGDLIFTGTPAGVGPVSTGDRMTAGIDGIGRISVAMT